MEIASPRGRFAPWTHGRHAAMGACIYLSSELRLRTSLKPFEALAIIGDNAGERSHLLVERPKHCAAGKRAGAAFTKRLSRLPTSPTLSRRANGTSGGPWNLSGGRSRSTAASSALRAAARARR